MARVPTDTSSLRGMRQGTRITATPVDTYVSVGNQVQRNSKTQQIANALAQVQPTIATYFDNEFNRFKADQKQEGLKSYLEASPEERKAYAKKIKTGEIDEIESPFFIEGVSRGVLRDKARDFGNGLIKEWNSKKDSAGFNVNDFIARYQDEYIKSNGLEIYDAEVFNQEFAQRAESFGNIVNQRAYEHSLQKAREYQLTSLGKDIVAARNESFDQKTGSFDSGGYVKKINEVVDDYIAQGLDPSRAIEEAKNNLHAMALQDLDNSDAYVNAMKGIKTRVGTFGETGTGALFTTKLADELDNRKEREQDEAYQDEVRERQKELDILTENALTQLVNEGPAWFDTKEGKDLLDNVLVNPEGGIAAYNAIRTQIETRDQVVTDPAVKAAYQARMLKGEDVASEILVDPSLSVADKMALKASNDTTSRLGSINSALGVNHVETFVGQATRRDTDALANVFGATRYDSLKPEATIMANDIVLEAASKFNVTTTQGKNEANKWIMEQLKDAEAVIEKRRGEINKTQQEGFNLGKTPSDITDIEEAPVADDKKEVLKLLPAGTVTNPTLLAREQKRPTTNVPAPVLKASDTSEVDSIEFLEDLELAISEFNRVAVNPEMSWENSQVFMMAARRGVSVEKVLEEIDTRLKGAPNRPPPEGIGPNGETLQELEQIQQNFKSTIANTFSEPKSPEPPTVDQLRNEVGKTFDRVQNAWDNFTQYFGDTVDLTMPTSDLLNNPSLQIIMQGIGVDLKDPAQAKAVAERINGLRSQTGITNEMAKEIEAYLEGK